LDIGGGPGKYSAWLAQLGYAVLLIDVVRLHVDQALELSDSQTQTPFSAEVGDATSIKVLDNSQDMVLLLGPLYHLLSKKERIQALSESHRVLKPGGIVIAAAITRYASLISGLVENILDDQEFKTIVEQDLKSGKHRPKTPKYFTRAYFHHAADLAKEIKESNFKMKDLLAVEGPFWIMKDLRERWENKKTREQLLYALGKIEKEPNMIAASLHFIGVGEKQ